jgi:Glycosyl hydrolase family 26
MAGHALLAPCLLLVLGCGEDPTAGGSDAPGPGRADAPWDAAAADGPGGGASIYWGAYVEGQQTYAYLYGGTWSNGPWCDPGTQCPLPKFTSNVGKRVSLEHWGMCWTCTFDAGVAAVVVARGDLPAVDWSNEGAADAQVAAGAYDTLLTAMAQSMRDFGHPLFLLFDEEMNGSWYGYSPGQNGNTAADFVAMWRHVHDVFVAVGASNVTWVWVPNVDPSDALTPMSSLYPGDAYVDWTGLNGYNWGGGAGGGWMTFAEVFTHSYDTLLAIAPQKPILVGETASEETGGSKAQWITDALTAQVPGRFPRIKGLMWFNWRIFEKNQYWSWEIESSASSQQAFADGIAAPYYAAGGGLGSLPLLTKIEPLP